MESAITADTKPYKLTKNYMPEIYGEHWSEEEVQNFAREQNRLNVERMGERLREAANSADKVINCVKIIKEACKRNPNGLPF